MSRKRQPVGVLSNYASATGQFDAHALQALARQATTASRSELAKSVVVLFDSPRNELSAEARAMAYDILHAIIRDIEMATRQEIARRLAEFGDVPSDLIRFLANDKIEVAYPVILKSGVLDDSDLIEIIRSRSPEHAHAVARRPSVNPVVANALVMTGFEDVIVAALNNPGANFAPGTIGYLVDKSREVKAIREPVLKRPEMNAELAVRMFAWVSAVLREYILRNFEIDKTAFIRLCEAIMLDEIEYFASKAGKGDAAKKINALIKNKVSVPPEMLIFALRGGDVNAFITAFTAITEIKAHMVDRILFDPTGKGLAVVCKSLDIGRVPFVSIFTLAQKIRAEVTGTIKVRMTAAMDFYDALPKQLADEMFGEWKRDADYVGSLRILAQRMQN